MTPEIKPPTIAEIEQAIKTKVTENTEINQALQEFEVKEASMASAVPSASSEEEVPKMVRWIMKVSGGAIKDQRQAKYALLVFVVLVIIFAVVIFMMSGE